MRFFVKKIFSLIIKENTEEVCLINTILRDMNLTFKAERYYTLFCSVRNLGSELKPWHNVPKSVLESLDKKVYELKDAIDTLRPDLRSKFRELEQNGANKK